jgi:hypothetical protein
MGTYQNFTKDWKQTETREADVCDGRLLIQFTYDPKTVALVKTLTGAKFHREGSKATRWNDKVWTASDTLQNRQNLADWGFNI